MKSGAAALDDPFSELQTRLAAVVERRLQTGSSVRDLQRMTDGHAGLTYAFVVERPGTGPLACVLKLAPAGVRRAGATDIARQAPLLNALESRDAPTPRILAASSEDDELGAPFIIMERLPGRTFIVWEPHASFDLSLSATRNLWKESVRLLVAIQALDVPAALLGPATTASAEVLRWAPLLAKASEPAWWRLGEVLAADLLRRPPDGDHSGLVHGDFQPGNILFDGGRITGLIDWDLACAGPQQLDLAWLLMMADPECWAADWAPRAPDPEYLVEAYRQAGGRACADLAWFRALACFRMGAIACQNVRLHRSGRRPDELWDRFAPSIDTLFSRGLRLLAGR